MSFEFVKILKKIERNQRRGQAQPPPNIVAPVKEYTIAAGVITLTGYDKIRFITVDTQSDDGTDDLDTINGGTIADIIICRSADSARDPTFKDATGNLNIAGDFTLTNTADVIMLIYNGTAWNEISRSDNA